MKRFNDTAFYFLGGQYLKTVCDYVHLNPARAKLVRAKEKLSAFTWSSYPQYR